MLPFHLVQSANIEFLLMKTQRAWNRLRKCVNVRYRENQMYLWFTINLTIKTKKIQHSILETFTKQNSPQNLARFHVALFEFEILEIFIASSLLKAIIWTWFFCQVLQSVLPDQRKKLLLIKDANHLKTAWHSKRHWGKPNNNHKYFLL